MTSFRTLRCKTRATTPWRLGKDVQRRGFILTRTPVRDVVRNIPGFDDEQSCVIAATLDTPKATALAQRLLCEWSGARL